MKKLIFGFIALISLSSFNLPSCKKQKDNCTTITVNTTIFEGGATITFTGEQGQGTFVFTEETDELNLPNTGTYQICATFGGGCGGLRVSKETSSGSENVILVMPQGGTECVSGQTLAEQYYASVNCE